MKRLFPVLLLIVFMSLMFGRCGGPSGLTVTYTGNGNTAGSVPVDPKTYSIGEPVTVLDADSGFRRDGYWYGGWNTAPDGSGYSAAPGGTLVMGTGDVVLHAQWKANRRSTYIDIAGGRIINGGFDGEYSLDDGFVWDGCDGALTDVAFSPGDRVWARDPDGPERGFLGSVDAVSGRGDIVPLQTAVGTGWFDDINSGAPGDTCSVLLRIKNIGDTSVDLDGADAEVYLSEDEVISGEDIRLCTVTGSFSLAPGESADFGSSGCFTVPAVEPGTYFVGFVFDVNNEVPELTTGNNRSLPLHLDEFEILDPAALPDGAVKVVNSWGTGGWENKADGHYWLSYDSMKSLKIPVRYYYNDFSHVYQPTAMVLFELDGVYRDDCFVTVGLGDPSSPFMEKEFQSRWGSTLYSGHLTFSQNEMALDVSEFAPYINDFDLYLRAENSSGSAAGSLDGLEAAFFRGGVHFKTVSGQTGTIASGSAPVFFVPTRGSLDGEEEQDIIPLERSLFDTVEFDEEAPKAEELARDMAAAGVYEPGRNYNVITELGFGTGDIPPTYEQWQGMVKLRDVESPLIRGAALPDEIDHSASKYFPPVGNQGSEGSCTCFSFGYYICTYTEAREHGWDLSGVSWTGGFSGQPDGSLGRIMSPDFIYHQINGGADNGSNGCLAASLIIRIGCASWEMMPYDTGDSSSWPGLNAFTTAGRHRGREVGRTYWDYTTNGYFIIEDDGDIRLLKKLLAAGYCVSTSIKADSGGVYDLFDANDVVSGYSGGPMMTNHANTIVGYKEGDEWDPGNPDE